MHQRASKEILRQRAAVADVVVALEEGAHHPEWERLQSRETAREDADVQLTFLAEAVARENPALFADYVGWAKVKMARRGDRPSMLDAELANLATALNRILPEELRELPATVIEYSRKRLPDLPENPPSFIEHSRPHSLLAREYLQLLLDGQRDAAGSLIMDAHRSGVTVQELYLDVFQRCQYEIGRLWQTNEIDVATEHYCSAATQFIMSQLYPSIFSGERHGGVAVCSSVAGDPHEIGARMVADFLELAGWAAHYLGASACSQRVIQTLMEYKASILGISATMTYHVGAVEELIRKVRSEPACAAVKILVGGYVFNLSPDLWQKIGADGTARDAAGISAIAERLTGQRALR